MLLSTQILIFLSSVRGCHNDECALVCLRNSCSSLMNWYTDTYRVMCCTFFGINSSGHGVSAWGSCASDCIEHLLQIGRLCFFAITFSFYPISTPLDRSGDLGATQDTEALKTSCHVLGAIQRWCVPSDMLHYHAGGIHPSVAKLWPGERWAWSAMMFRHALQFSSSSIGIRGPEVCQQNILQTITRPPSLCCVHIKRDGFGCFI